MKQKDLSVFRGKTVEGLGKTIGEKSRELLDARLSFRIGKVKNVRRMKELRKEIAQLKTLLTEKGAVTL